jgi:hypothetical protein
MPCYDDIITQRQMHRLTLPQRQGSEWPRQGGLVDEALLGAHLGRGTRWRTGSRETIGFSKDSGEAEPDAGVVTIMSSSLVLPGQASRGWPGGSPPSCRP